MGYAQAVWNGLCFSCRLENSRSTHAQPILKGKMELTANPMQTVLIADDDTTLSQLWRELLSDAGFDVLRCANGREAVDTIRQGKRVDVVLLDYNMPEQNGAETLEQLRDEFPDVKAIGVTGVSCSELPATYLEQVEQLLMKPIQSSDLIDAIISVVGVPVAAQSKTAKSSTYWVKFSLCYALFLIITCGLLFLLRNATNDVISFR
jgi:CheY-like chemotaxis protein